MDALSKFKDLGIKWKLMSMSFLIVLISVVGVGYFSYDVARNQAHNSIEHITVSQVEGVGLFAQATYQELEQYDANIENQAKSMVNSQANVLAHFINGFEGDDERLKDIISKVRVGDTGYVWVIDYDGNYVVSLNRQRDGENIWGG
jgi:signal transduction histidine kinase